MRGTRNPSNILLELDCSYHEPCGNNHTNDYQPYRSPYSDRYSSLEGHDTRDTQSYPSTQDTRRPCSAPYDFSARRLECRTPKYDGYCLEQCSQKDNEAKSIQPAEFDRQFTQGVLRESHTKSAPLGRDICQKQFRQGTIEKSIHDKTRRGPNACDYLRQWQDVENFGRYRKIDNECSKDKPGGAHFSCNDCMEPQCLYCWRKLREATRDFSFLDGFETQEPKWRPSKRSVEQYNNFYSGPNQNNFRRQTSLDDRVHCENSNYKQSTSSQSSCSLEEPMWKPATTLHHEDSEPKDQHTTRRDTMSKEIEWNWPLGKGRGIGPVQGEWIPPFRKLSSDSSTPIFQRSKGVGAIPNLDDWVPPFRGEEQPYDWHRCKGSGGCPPRDQWLAPWCSSSKQK